MSRLKEFKTYIKQTWVGFPLAFKLIFSLCLAVILLMVGMRLFALKYQRAESSREFEFGTTYVSSYAESLGLDKREPYLAILDELKPKNVRLVSHWSAHEVERGRYDFTELDWQVLEAEKRGVKLSLAIGLRQPRYPECHSPAWAKDLTKDEWYPELKKYIAEVVNRYKDSPSLVSYQLENEFFLEAFGDCTDFSRERLVEEFELVKKLDPDTPIVLSRSNNYGGFAIGEPRADIYGISVYRKVHNQTLGYVTYPFPAWYYAFLAQGQLSLTGRPSIIHEFQLEPWLKSGSMKEASLEEQDKTMSVEDVRANIEFARRTGIKEVYFWGSEWWYWRMQNGDSRVWEVVREEFN